jgi:cytochrome c556
MLRKLTISAAALAASAAFLQVSAVAQTGAGDRQTAAIEARQAAMKRIGAAMKTLVGFSKGDVTDKGQAVEAAKTIEASGRQFGKLLPKGTEAGVGKSKAKPEIWTDSRTFDQQMKALISAAAATRKAAAKGDPAAVGAQLGPLCDTCKSCHGKFQKKG